MIEIGNTEIKQLQVDILKVVHNFCVSNNIRYSLAFGTLIGAVRHKGYIPWDDDLDIMMPRPDYNRFIREFGGFCESYTVLSPENDLNFDYSYAQIFDTRTLLLEKSMKHHYEFGVKIDLFPVDGTPQLEDNHLIKSRKLRRLMSLNYYKLYRLTYFLKNDFSEFLKKCFHKTESVFSSFCDNNDRIIKLLTEDKFESSEFVDVYLCPYSTKNIRVPKSVFESYKFAQFEEERFMIVSDYDTLLRKIYGDYMTLPPENKRVCPHNFEAYWKKDSILKVTKYSK